MAERIAVVDVARELRIRSAAILDFARKNGMDLRSAAQPISEAQAQRIRLAYKEGRIELPHQRGYGGPLDESGPSRREGRCSCCGLPYTFDVHNYAARCDDCADHYPIEDEDDERVIARLSNHVEKLRGTIQQAGENAAKSRQERERAFKSRDVWKRVLIEVAVSHLPDEDSKGCLCGAGSFPCVTRRQIAALNPGIAKEIERLEGLPEDEFQEVLYGDLKHLRNWEPF